MLYAYMYTYHPYMYIIHVYIHIYKHTYIDIWYTFTYNPYIYNMYTYNPYLPLRSPQLIKQEFGKQEQKVLPLLMKLLSTQKWID